MRLKRPAALALAAVLLLTTITAFITVFAEEITWEYDNASDTLYIDGSGAMEDYTASGRTPWSAYLSDVRHVVIGEGVTTVGANAFAGSSSLEDASFPDSMTSIGSNAFASCPQLLSLTLSENIISIADVSFAFDGATEKSGFAVNVTPGSFALFYAYQNSIPFNCDEITTGVLNVTLQKGMTAYFPYTAQYTGRYKLYSVSKHDSIGYIYDSNRSQIAYNDDHAISYSPDAGSTDFGLTKTLTKGETYYIAVKVFNPSLKARFSVYFEPEEYTVSGTVYAMNSPDGDASDIPIGNVTLDGETLENSSFTVTVNGLSKTVEFTADGVTLEHTFRVEDGDSIVISMMMCDVNADGIVNAKDYALMQKENSPYISLFSNFMNYRTE